MTNNKLIGVCIFILIATVILFTSIDPVDAKRAQIKSIGGGFAVDPDPTPDPDPDPNDNPAPGTNSSNDSSNISTNVSTNISTNITINESVNESLNITINDTINTTINVTINETTNNSNSSDNSTSTDNDNNNNDDGNNDNSNQDNNDNNDEDPNDNDLNDLNTVHTSLTKPVKPVKPSKDICKEELNCIKNPVLPAYKSASFYPEDQATYFYSGNDKVMELIGTKKTYYHFDYSKSLSLKTNEIGNVISEYVNLPFGSPVKNTVGDFHGKEQDQSGLFYYGARYYDPIMGRFTQPDKVQRSDVSPYMYSNNDPLNKLDPDGNDDKKTQSRPKGPGNEIDLNQVSRILQIRDAGDAKKFAEGAALSQVAKRTGVPITAVLLPVDIWIEMANQFQESSDNAQSAGRVKDLLFSQDYGYAIALPGLFPRVDGVATMDDLRASIELANLLVEAQILIRQLAVKISVDSGDRIAPSEVFMLLISTLNLDPEDPNLIVLKEVMLDQEDKVQEKREAEEKEDEE